MLALPVPPGDERDGGLELAWPVALVPVALAVRGGQVFEHIGTALGERHYVVDLKSKWLEVVRLVLDGFAT